MNEQTRPDLTDESDIARLLQAAGARPAPDASAVAAARSAVEAEWRSVVTAHRRRRAFTGWAVAASVAAAAVAVWIARPLLQPERTVVASLERVVGDVQQNRGDGRWVPLGAGGALESGTSLRTAADSRAALSLASGMELRLDARTVLVLDGRERATLSEGAVYVDSGSPPGQPPATGFVLDTPQGSVRHLGTQYEARLLEQTLQVGVREGRVSVATAHGDAVGSAGERLAVSGTGVSRSPLPPTDPSWSWIGAVTPPFSIEGRSVEEFLVWAARQTGRTIVYTSAGAAEQARAVTLSGTVEGLSPEEAVTAVLSTTSLQPEIGSEHIRVRHGTP